MTDRPDDPDKKDQPEDEEVPRLAYVQPDAGGSTITADRGPHPNPGMEARFREAEEVGFRIEQRTTQEWGTYFWFSDDCDPPHVGTVNEREVYAIAVDRILKRCPRWK